MSALCVAAANADPPSALQSESLLAGLPQAVVSAAIAIPDPGRRLLAARAYLRAGDSLSTRWSWTAEEFRAFAESEQGRALDRAVAAVRCQFAVANPGYELFVNPEFRTLEIQIERWNANASVGRAAQHLLQSLRKELGDAPDAQAVRTWLRAHAPQPVLTLAAPGLSPHGRASAIDFQVRQGGRLVAGPDSTTVRGVWEQSGWEQKLVAAVARSRAPFEGPLQTPREPWHFRYAPEAAATSQPLASCPDR